MKELVSVSLLPSGGRYGAAPLHGAVDFLGLRETEVHPGDGGLQSGGQYST
jgi:hypothetical protein